ncbi:hypothetical protein [Streptomyces xanthophaeus]|uniref:hypothetical protein n=1 Tax=Streptomyces xanthophaeus TaxID=67385 RepID=UPI0026483E55|nr:hypothetical protein [Streptomyces xanthophaeus]WKD36506.1 hypothetical protein KO717_34295 [Streptomyces xanthophaeus]
MAPETPESPPPPPPPPPARYAITAPGPVSGGVHGVGFANGHAIITDAGAHRRALDWFRTAPGYTVEEIDPPQTEEPPPAAPEPAPEPDTEPPAEPEPDEAPTVRRKGRS